MAKYVKTRWGRDKVILDMQKEGYKIKLLEIGSGHHISTQYHNCRQEHWSIIQGTGELMVDNTLMFIEPGDNIHIPQGATHKVTNIGECALKIIETQIGLRCEESDIVRLEEIKNYKPIDIL